MVFFDLMLKFVHLGKLMSGFLRCIIVTNLFFNFNFKLNKLFYCIFFRFVCTIVSKINWMDGRIAFIIIIIIVINPYLSQYQVRSSYGVV